MKKQFKREGIFLSRGFNTVRKFLVLRNIAYASSVMLLVLIASTIIPIYHKPVTAEATVGTATESTLTFTSTRSTASVTLTVDSADGTFATSAANQTAAFSIATNNYTGYTLTLKSGGNVTALDNSGTTISTISAATNADTFAADTAAGKALNNKWGIIPNYYNATGDSPVTNTTNYYPAPTSTNAITLRETSTANSSNGVDNADNYTIGLGLRADYTNPSGTYTNNTFIIQYVANAVGYNITYSADGISGVSNLPGVQPGSASHTETPSTSGSTTTVTTGATSVTLSSTVPTRTGYTFSGWCLGTLSNNGTTCTGTTYASGASFGIDKTANNASITLKAKWTIKTYAITFTFGTGISDIVVKDSTGDNTIATISTSGGSTNLTYSTTYKIVPTFTGDYELNAMTITTGSGTLSGTSFTVGAGTATINTTGKVDPCKGKTALYDLVACRSKGKNTASSSGFSWTSITAATSGVYEWDGKTTGNGVDSNGGSSKIYFYRGILDTTTATYGSNGMADAYPNYVKLANNTCWRIVRTTSTGGVKMIYNGIYGDTTAGSCANAQTKAQTRYNNADLTVPFNTSSSTKAGKTYSGLQYQNIHAVGYTYTSSVAASTTATKTPAQLFGASGNDITTNNKSSIMKQYIEDWYAANMTAYTSILEGDAGYCQDRRLNTGTTWTSALAEDSNTVIPYGTSGMTQYYFGAYPRNMQSSTFNPLLTCPRGKVDLYSYSADAGNGNGQLTYPVALLTADEASLAGSGYSNSFNAYNANSFLRSGSDFWLLSPRIRGSYGNAFGFGLSSNGFLNFNYVNGTYGVRPAISLTSGTTAASGSGTATDPWVVTAP